MAQSRFSWMGRFLGLTETSFPDASVSVLLFEIFAGDLLRLNAPFEVVLVSAGSRSLVKQMTADLSFSLQRHRRREDTFCGFGFLFASTTQLPIILFRYEYLDRLGFFTDCWLRSGWPMQPPSDYEERV